MYWFPAKAVPHHTILVRSKSQDSWVTPPTTTRRCPLPSVRRLSLVTRSLTALGTGQRVNIEPRRSARESEPGPLRGALLNVQHRLDHSEHSSDQVPTRIMNAPRLSGTTPLLLDSPNSGRCGAVSGSGTTMHHCSKSRCKKPSG